MMIRDRAVSPEPVEPVIVWVVLTMGDRPTQFGAAIASIAAQRSVTPRVKPVVVLNGGGALDLATRDSVTVIDLDNNVGIPAGRDIGIRASAAAFVGSLDDDASLAPDVTDRALEVFASGPRVGAVALRIVDENGRSARTLVPRVGTSSAERGGPVSYFLGGAHVLRAEAYDDVGGYFTDLWYGHEEIELSWRLIDAGWSIEYVPEAVAFHPDTPISRHIEGWSLTGRNRVWIARRTLPWLVAICHVLIWLVIGLIRAPKECRRAYLRGWLSGWRESIERRPIRWSTVWRLTRLGRPPVI